MMTTSPHWPHGLPDHLSAPETSLYANLEVAATRYPEKAALLYYGSAMSYRRLRSEVDAMAGFLQQHCGLTRGDRVVLYMQNSPQFIIAFYAILRADAVVVPVNPMNLTAELQYIVEDSGAKIAFVGDELLSNVEPLFDHQLDTVVGVRYADYLFAETDLALPDVITPVKRQAPQSMNSRCNVVDWVDALHHQCVPRQHDAGPNDLAVIPYTSGTTGRPKGCMHTHRTTMHVAVSCAEWPSVPKDTISLCSLPLFHVTGMQNCMNMPIFLGATVVLMTRWDARCAAQLIERHRVRTWVTIPTMLIDLLNQPDVGKFDLSSLSYLSGGGAAMPQALAKQIRERWNIPYVEGYGLSETMSATHINPPRRSKEQCLGIPIFDTESMVVDPSTFEPADVGAIGEILVHGPQVFEGYWRAPDATQDAFVEMDGKQYLRTGDLGYVDADGYFFMVDRVKRMINASGYKVWPAEVETMLFEHPAIQEACVISARDVRRGESVKAVVVVRDGFTVTEEQLIAWARERMASYKVPRLIQFASSLPRTASGKVQWRLLQEAEFQGGEAS
ncbi:long-chain-fatty-acid--CoA ligase [Cupriavidus sp. WKF15]|uniref:long-chain-fatty-acid--CoA ligase n=1 Tax=Cupriavidus sp. WKF15 TaxID=3032282 RepID=UPI0023E14F3F|nr:long-chain-fatty-acid--CoA ligase [Cupriavidus sp. WKF15]WER50597.1 long-chain-fatty-acid--CoA ligase [Cupriavidus sp. WKF15]